MQPIPSQIDEKTAVVLFDYFKRHPVEWLKFAVKTFDEHDAENPIKAFPVRPYVPAIVEAYQTEEIIHLPKSRQMSVSWLLMALILHEAQFFGYRLQAVFSKKEEDAFQLVERAKFMYDNQPAWLKALSPLDRKMRDMQLGHLYFKNGSKIRGFAQGKDQIRQYVPSTALLDEAAFQDKLEETYGALVPCSQRIVTVSSANAGYFQRLVEL
jgi:hypothetical protein